MLNKILISVAICTAWLSGTLAFAGEAATVAPLAYSSAPPCSKRPGVRAIRSELVELGQVSASLSGQAVREETSCVQSASLWITQKGISQQFELRDAGQNIFAILDIAPDSSSILLGSIATYGNPEDDHSAQMAILSLPDGALKWTPVAEVLGYKNCDATIEPQGFLDATHVLISAVPVTSTHPHASCTDKPLYFSYDLSQHTVKPSAKAGVDRYARSVEGPLQSCKSDPDVVAACYTKRARISATGTGESLLVWPLGENRTMMVEESMVPTILTALVAPDRRVYATMVICPLLADQPGRRAQICVDSATNLRLEAVTPKIRPAASKSAPEAAGESH